MLQEKQTVFLREAIGWYGTAAILLAYILVSLSVITAHALSYQILNLTGAAAIAFDALGQKNYQPVVLNIVWATIALIGIIKSLL